MTLRGDRSVPARVDGHEAALSGHRRDRVVEGDDADGASWHGTRQRRPEPGRHPGQPRFDLQTQSPQHVLEMLGGGVLLVRQLGMGVDEGDRLAHEVRVAGHGRAQVRVGWSPRS